jgi:hypothetical protein
VKCAWRKAPSRESPAILAALFDPISEVNHDAFGQA